MNGDSRVSREDPWGCPTVCEGREGGMTLGRYDSLRLCPQVELRSYVSEPELATFSGDMAQPSLGLVGPDSRYQTLPGRGKAHLSMEAFWEPLLLPYHCSLVTHLVPYTLPPAALGLSVGSSCQGDSGLQGGPVLPSSDPHPDSLLLLLHLPLEIMIIAITLKPSTISGSLYSPG